MSLESVLSEELDWLEVLHIFRVKEHKSCDHFFLLHLIGIARENNALHYNSLRVATNADSLAEILSSLHGVGAD